jgi:hypothetical protein
MDPDPPIFVIDLQEANKKLIFYLSCSAYYFMKVHLHHFSKIKSQKEVTKQWESGSGSATLDYRYVRRACVLVQVLLRYRIVRNKTITHSNT